MIFTSFYHHFSINDIKPNSHKDKAYEYNASKTKEMSVLWYLYVREFLPKNEHILIYDQIGPIKIEYLFPYIREPFELVCENRVNENFRVHIKRATHPTGQVSGLKNLYFYLYDLCYKQNLDFFFIENDCLIAYDWLSKCQNYDFATNTINKRECVCDTYINYISNKKFHEKDNYQKFDEWLDFIENINIYDGKAIGALDVISQCLIERGVFANFCFGNVLQFNNDKVIHNPQDINLLKFLENNPINHSFVKQFIENLKIKIDNDAIKA